MVQFLSVVNTCKDLHLSQASTFLSSQSGNYRYPYIKGLGRRGRLSAQRV